MEPRTRMFVFSQQQCGTLPVGRIRQPSLHKQLATHTLQTKVGAVAAEEAEKTGIPLTYDTSGTFGGVGVNEWLEFRYLISCGRKNRRGSVPGRERENSRQLV